MATKTSTSSLSRRSFIWVTGAAAAAVIVFLRSGMAGGSGQFNITEKERFAVAMSDAEWKAKLTPEQYRVLREEGTERAFTSPLNAEKRTGIFTCAGCGAQLFSSVAKYDSGTGWPSFYQPVTDKAVGTSTDHKLIYPRTEVHCATCGGHLGHVFDDGPRPTGLRYCMNGTAMNFLPAETEK